MCTKGGVYGLCASKRQEILVPQLIFTASSRAEAGVVWQKGSGGNASFQGALTSALPAAWGLCAQPDDQTEPG